MDVLAERRWAPIHNQRDEHYLMASLQDESYRKQSPMR